MPSGKSGAFSHFAGGRGPSNRGSRSECRPVCLWRKTRCRTAVNGNHNPQGAEDEECQSPGHAGDHRFRSVVGRRSPSMGSGPGRSCRSRERWFQSASAFAGGVSAAVNAARQGDNGCTGEISGYRLSYSCERFSACGEWRGNRSSTGLQRHAPGIASGHGPQESASAGQPHGRFRCRPA
jgi:hypothetical protein